MNLRSNFREKLERQVHSIKKYITSSGMNQLKHLWKGWHYSLINKEVKGQNRKRRKEKNKNKTKQIIYVTCKSRFMGIGLLRSHIISETAFNWLGVRENGRSLNNFLVRMDHPSTEMALGSWFLYLSNNPSFSIWVPRPSSIWNSRPNWEGNKIISQEIKTLHVRKLSNMKW